MEDLAHDLFEQWNQTLLAGAEQVASLYQQDALLLPTISSEFCSTSTKIKNYFNVFCQKKPQGEILESKVFYSEKTIIFAGHYVFTLNGSEKAEARFTFVFEKVKETNEAKLGRDWLIAHHHSSVFP